jgi:hypothetical protein
MNKQEFNNAVKSIDNSLVGNPNARNLFMHIVFEAEKDNSETMEILTHWLTKGGTVILRDDICDAHKNKFDNEIDWFNAFCSIDDVGMKVREVQ